MPPQDRSCELSVKVTPRSGRNEIQIVNGQVKVWVTAAPTDNQANEAVCRLMAKKLGISNSSVQVLRGHSSREKVITVNGRSDAETRRLLENTEPH